MREWLEHHVDEVTNRHAQLPVGKTYGASFFQLGKDKVNQHIVLKANHAANLACNPRPERVQLDVRKNNLPQGGQGGGREREGGRSVCERVCVCGGGRVCLSGRNK